MNGITRKPAFWVVYALVSLAALAVALRLFPLAIPIVNLDITMSRSEAAAAARALAARLSSSRPPMRARRCASTTMPRRRTTSSSKAAARARLRG